MPFGMWALVSPSNYVLDGGRGPDSRGRGRPIVKCYRKHDASAAERRLVRDGIWHVDI